MGKTPKPVDPSFQAMAEVLSLGMSYQLAVSPDGFERRFLYASESCLALNGVSAEAVMADPQAFYDLVVPEHRDLTARITSQAMLDRRPLMVEYAIRLPHGALGWRRATAAPRAEPGADGWTIWDGLQVDITEHKQAELALEAERRRLELAVEAGDLGLWEYDIPTDTAVWSDRTKALYGLPPEAELHYETWMAQSIHPDDQPAMEAAYLNALATPEARFSVEHRAIAPDGGVRWLLAHGRILRDESGPRTVLGTVLDITSRREAEDQRRLVMGELAHRSRNGLAMILAIIQQTSRTVSTVKAYEASLMSRIGAMVRSQDLITSGAGPLTLADLFNSALEPFDVARFDIDAGLAGHRLNADTALMLALLIHELGTNATKYGALSVPDGRVAVDAEGPEPGMAGMVWREQGGPPVVAPTRKGFGSRLMEAALRAYGGSVETKHHPDGLEARLRFPVVEA